MFFLNFFRKIKKQIKNIDFNLKKNYEIIVYDEVLTDPITECIEPSKNIGISSSSLLLFSMLQSEQVDCRFHGWLHLNLDFGIIWST